jgi:hypothetical protein
MGGQIAGHGDQDAPARDTVAPLAKLPHACLEHLVGVKARILAQQRTGQRRDQSFGRVTEKEVPGDEAR